MPRRTADVIALVLALVVALVVLLTTVTLLWLKVTNPSSDTGQAADAIGRITSVLVAALVGYMAGRRVDEP